MFCVFQILVDDEFVFNVGSRYEYLVRLESGNYFISIEVTGYNKKNSIAYGHAHTLTDDFDLPVMGDVLGFNESDVRGWVLLLPDIVALPLI